MKHAMVTTVSRRDWLARLLMSAAIAPVVGVTLADTANADKKKKEKIPSVSDRTDNQRISCEAGGGTLAVQDGPNGGNTTECKGGTDNGKTCFNTKKSTKCHKAIPNVPTTNAGGGGAVPPSGGAEDPSDGDGTNAGGGAHVPPSGGVDPSGGGSDPVLE